MKNSFLLALILLSSVSVFAQNQSGFVLSGVVQDSVTGKKMDFVTVSLKDSLSKSLKTTLTQANGIFTFGDLKAGQYSISIIAVGYAKKSVAIGLQKSIDLGALNIKPEANNLKDVVVTADRPLVKQDVDRITYDVQADPESKVLTVLDMMRKVPMLSVDADDQIKMNGSTSYKILINGRPSTLIARSPTDVLRAMPASNIKDIEVITTPPSKYDSEGLAGIINIITNKKVDNGYNGSVGSRVSFPSGGPGVFGSFTIKQGKFGISGFMGLNNYNSPNTVFRSDRYSFLSDNTMSALLVQNGQREQNALNGYSSAEMSYEIDSLNLVTGGFDYWDGYWKGKGLQQSLLTDASNTILQRYQINNINRNDYGGLGIMINYQKGFKSNKDRLLTFSYKYMNNATDNGNDLVLSDRLNYSVPDYIQTNEGNSIEQTFQADYVHPTKIKLNIEGGVKLILRDNSSDFESKNKTSSGDYVLDPSQTNSFDNNQNVLGLYNSYQYNTKNWGFKGGLRIEGTFINADFRSSNVVVDQDYFNVIPTLAINRKMKNMSSLNIGYTQRIQRPDISNLNPFVNRVNPNYMSSGNPALRPVLSNNIDFKYTRFKKGSISTGLSYAFSNNTIQRVSIFDPATNVTISTYKNVGKTRQLSTNTNVSYPATKKLNLNVNANIGYVWLQGVVNGLNQKNSGFRGYFYTGAGYKFEKNWRANASLSYSTPYITLQGKGNSFPYFTVSCSKDIIKDKLNVNGAVSNPFGKFRYNDDEVRGVNFISTSSFQNYQRNFNLNLSYRFGKLKDGIKKSKRTINNDDVSGGRTGGN